MRVREMVPRRGEVGELVRLAVPVVTVQVGMMFMGVVDTVMVGHVSPRDLAAVALGNLYFFGATVFGMGTLFALDPVISQAVGAGDDEGVARGLQRGALLAFGLTLLASALVVPVGPALALLRQPPEVVPVAAGYAWMATPGIFPFYLFVVCRVALQAMGRLAPIVVTIVVANLANVLFNWVLIYGELGFPALGAVGAGLASSLSRWLMAGAVLVAAWRVFAPHLRPLRRDVLALAPLVRLLGLGAPIGAQFALEFGAFGVTGLLMGWFGTIAMAGHQVALNLAALTFMVPVGVSQAAAVLVGRAVGRSDTPGARRAAGAGLLLGVGFMVTTAVMFRSIPGLLARVYTTDTAVLGLAVSLIPIAGLFQVFDGIQVVASAVLRGVGDTRVPMVIVLLGFWLVGLPVSIGVAFGLDGGAVGLWWGLVAGLGAVAFLLLWRVRRSFGRDLRRLVIDDEAVAGQG